MCQCEEGVVQRLEQDFKLTLQQQNSLEQWAAWLDGVVTQVLRPYQGSAGFPKAAKLFLLKWSFYRCAAAAGRGAEPEDSPSPGRGLRAPSPGASDGRPASSGPQLHGDPGPDPAQRCQLRLLPPHPAAL